MTMIWTVVDLPQQQVFCSSPKHCSKTMLMPSDLISYVKRLSVTKGTGLKIKIIMPTIWQY